MFAERNTCRLFHTLSTFSLFWRFLLRFLHQEVRIAVPEPCDDYKLVEASHSVTTTAILQISRMGGALQ